MNCLLISPYSDIYSLGIRTLSAVLKRNSHQVKMVFLPDTRYESIDIPDFVYTYPEEVIEAVAELGKDSHLIGISVMTQYFDRAANLTKGLRDRFRGNIPLLWGGIHPTIRPEESLQIADLICLGESEEAFLELCNLLETGKDYSSAANIWLKKNGEVLKNQLRPYISDLDQLPSPDYSLEDDYIWDWELQKMLKMDKHILRQHVALGPISEVSKRVCYLILSSRGCPYNCSFCNNSALRKIYGKTITRWRSVDHVLEELKNAQETFGKIELVFFSDDSFMERNIEELKLLSERYEKEIKIPFFCTATPLSLTEERLEILVKAGLSAVQMGIQTGSEPTKKLYNRHFSNQKVLQATKLIHKYRDRLELPRYDLILDNPFENSKDLLKTFQLMLKIPRPYDLQLFSLTFFPETGIYHKAKEEGLIQDEQQQIYRKQLFLKKYTYLNLLFILLENGFPLILLKFLSQNWLVKISDSKFATRIIIFLMKTVKKLQQKAFFHKFSYKKKINKISSNNTSGATTK